MIHKQLFLMLILTGYTNLSFSENHPLEDNTASKIPPEALSAIHISKEESYYIFSECKQFALDDKIESDYLDDYVEVCAHELTLAVKVAKYQLQKKKTETQSREKSNTKPPKPL